MLQAEQILQERYQLQARLGRTAAGRQTWLARDLQSNEQVIVKLLAFSPQMQWDELKLFEREAQVLANLNHPRIPRYRDYFSLDRQIGEGLPWFGIVQDYIPGASLQELLEQGKRFSEKQVKNIATQVLDILIYLHSLSPPVLHRDIKPSNLIWGEDEQVYLVDFGAVQDKAALTGVTFTVVGTSGYSPLEQFWGRAVPASDLYALGATLIHLLTGIAPADLPQKDSRIQFADRVSLSRNFVSWIEQLTEIAIEKRFSNAQQALQALEFGLVLPSPTTESSTIRKIPKPPRTGIEINKSTEQLEIHIPAMSEKKPGSFGFGNAISGLFLVTFSLPISLWSGSMLVTGLVTVIRDWRLLIDDWKYTAFMFLVIMFLAMLAAIPVALFLHFFCERTHIYFNRNSFEIERQIFRFTYRRQRGAVADIWSVVWEQVGIFNDVIIRSGAKTYRLNNCLNEYECAWLAQQIHDWLDLR